MRRAPTNSIRGRQRAQVAFLSGRARGSRRDAVKDGLQLQSLRVQVPDGGARRAGRDCLPESRPCYPESLTIRGQILFGQGPFPWATRIRERRDGSAAWLLGSETARAAWVAID